MLAFISPSSSKQNKKEVFNKLLIVVDAKSNQVVAGGKYQASIYLYSVPESNPLITVMGRQLDMDENKAGKLSFTATPGVYDKDGICKKVFRGRVAFPINGKDTMIDFAQEYIVEKPIFKKEGAMVNVLYKQCGNKLLIDVPEMGKDYSPSFRAEGASVIAGVQKGEVIIVPVAS